MLDPPSLSDVSETTLGQAGLALFLAAIYLGPMAWRLTKPVPEEDRKAIAVFVKNRDQTLVALRKLWIGGPGEWSRAGYKQYGRPYRLIASSPDGSRWRHDVVMLDERDELGDPKVMRRTEAGWTPVLQ